MPITLSCNCGKVFKVKDEAAGTLVTCQVCGNQITATAQIDPPPVMIAQVVPPPPAGAASSDSSINAEKRIKCPACAEDIAAKTRRCPHCGEVIELTVPQEELALIAEQSLARLDEFLSNASAIQDDKNLAGGFLSVKSWIICAIMLIGILFTIAAAFTDSAAFGVPGVIIDVIFFIPVIVTLVNDYKGMHIQDVAAPEAAFRNFIQSVRTKRTNKAFVALIPSARKAGPVETIKFKNPKIPENPGKFSITDFASFKKYWLSVFRGPSGQSRTVAVKSVKVLQKTSNMAVLNVNLQVTNYPSYIVLTVLIHLLVCVLLIYFIQQKEEITIRKVLFRRGGRWYVAESALQGPLDQFSCETE